MKNVLRIFVLVGILSLGVTACNTDDGLGLNDRYINFGMVDAVGEDVKDGFNIRLDNGAWLVINNSWGIKNLEDQQRVIVIYTLVGELDPYQGDKRYLAIMNDYAKVLYKDPVLQSFIDEDPEKRQDSIGYDPIRVDRAWTGGKYLNVEFSVARQLGTNKLHFINLVADDKEDDGVMNLYLRHNGYEDVPAEGSIRFDYATSIVSFDLTGLLPEGSNELDIKLHWTQYSSTDWNMTFDGEKKGTFRPYNKEERAPSAGDINLDASELIR